MLYYLIEEDGVQSLVFELSGHENAKVLEKGVTAPKVPGCERVNGKWKIVDKDKTRRAIMINNGDKTELVDKHIALEKRLAALEALVDKLTPK